MPTPQIDPSPVDDRSEKNIKTLLPEVQVLARSLVHAAEHVGITIRVISGSRTYDEQHALFLQSKRPLEEVNAARKKAGMEPIDEKENKKNVTKADAGHSNHNFQIAFDIGVFDGTNYLGESPLYKAVAVLGKQLGLSWGGDWKSITDEPHYELRPHWATNMTEDAMLAQLRQRVSNKQDLFA